MRLENLEEVNNLNKRRNQILNLIQFKEIDKEVITICFDKQKLLSIFHQIDIQNDDHIRNKVLESLLEVETKMKKLGVELK